MYQNESLDNAAQVIERGSISSNASSENNFLFNFLRVAMSCMESTWEYLIPEFGVHLSSTSDTDEDNSSASQSSSNDNLEENSFYANEEESSPDLSSKSELQVNSAITIYALKKMGQKVSFNDVVLTEEVKNVRRNSLLTTHPDKSSPDSAAFIQQQDAYAMLLNEEYNPNETEQKKNVRRYTLFERTILPDLQNEQMELKSKVEKLSIDFDEKSTEIQEQIAELKNEILFNHSKLGQSII